MFTRLIKQFVMSVFVLTPFLLAIPFELHGQSNPIKTETHSNEQPKGSKHLVSVQDIEETTKFVFSVSNGSVLIDTPYAITVTEGNVHINISRDDISMVINEDYPLDKSTFETFKSHLNDGRLHTSKRTKDNPLRPGDDGIELVLYKNQVCFFDYGNWDTEILCFDGSLYDIFWKVVPETRESFENRLEMAKLLQYLKKEHE